MSSDIPTYVVVVVFAEEEKEDTACGLVGGGSQI